MNPPVLRAPNGVVQDGDEFLGAGKAYYDPRKITVPTLLVLGEWDRDTPPYMAQALFPLLVNAPGKRYVLLAEGTHTIIMEKNRLKLFEAVQASLTRQAGRNRADPGRAGTGFRTRSASTGTGAMRLDCCDAAVSQIARDRGGCIRGRVPFALGQTAPPAPAPIITSQARFLPVVARTAWWRARRSAPRASASRFSKPAATRSTPRWRSASRSRSRIRRPAISAAAASCWCISPAATRRSRSTIARPRPPR